MWLLFFFFSHAGMWWQMPAWLSDWVNGSVSIPRTSEWMTVFVCCVCLLVFVCVSGVYVCCLPACPPARLPLLLCVCVPAYVPAYLVARLPARPAGGGRTAVVDVNIVAADVEAVRIERGLLDPCAAPQHPRRRDCSAAKAVALMQARHFGVCHKTGVYEYDTRRLVCHV
eukprot:SAG11_NODE_1397_length_5032_cov_14.008109_3_plen_170_part_00